MQTRCCTEFLHASDSMKYCDNFGQVCCYLISANHALAPQHDGMLYTVQEVGTPGGWQVTVICLNLTILFIFADKWAASIV